MKKTLFTLSLSILVFTLIISSCKKSDNTTSGGSSSTSGTTTSGTTAGNGNPSGSYNGFLITIYGVQSSYTISTGAALFFANPTTINPGTNLVATATVNSVYVGSTRFSYSSSNKEYTDSTWTLSFPPAAWNINGAGSIPSFTYTNNDGLPIYTGMSSLPSTILKSQNLTIPISGVSGADQIEVDINDSLNNTTSMFVAANATSVTFSKDSLAKLTSCYANGSIAFTILKYNPQTLGGKSFLFGTAKQFSKNGVALH